MYYRLKDVGYSNSGTIRDPELLWTASFFSGKVLTSTFELPLRYYVDNTPENPPAAIEGITVPAFSAPFVYLLRTSGVDNIQLFEAVLINEKTGQIRKDYFAVNILGKISCAAVEASKATVIAEQPGSEWLYKFHNLVIDPSKIDNLLIFRLAEQPSMVIIHEKILFALEQTPNPTGKGWGIACFPIDEV